MYKTILPFLLLSCLTLALVSCSDDDNNNVIDSFDNVTQDPNLLGTFSGTCASAGFIDAGVKDVYRFEGNDFTQTRVFYIDGNCADDQKIGEIRYDGKFTIDSDSDTVTNGGAVDIELQIASLLVTQQGLADLFNAISFCGRNDYAPGASVDLGAVETDAITCPVDKVQSTRFGAYTVEGNTLYLNQDGLGGMAATKEERPDEVIKTSSYSN